MFSIICSSPSTRRARRRCASGDSASGFARHLVLPLLALLFLTDPSLAAKITTVEAAPQVTLAPTGVFQSLEIATNASTGIESWRSVQARMARENKLYSACDSGKGACPAHIRAWRGKLSAWQHLSVRAKLIQVNRFANAAVAYVDDRKLFHKADYWASPAESLKGRGDCEDYALLKYASLRAMGFAEDNLRIVIVKDLNKGIGHAVLAVKAEGSIFILDNQDKRVLRHDTVTGYAPVYSVNARGRWINIATRDLKQHKPAPAALVASAEELGEALPLPAAAPQAKDVETAKRAAAGITVTFDPRPPVTVRAARVGDVVSAAEREPMLLLPARAIRKLAAYWPPLHWLMTRQPA